MGRSGVEFATAYEDGVSRLVEAVERVVASGGGDWGARLSSGLRAGLGFLAADPPLARLLLVDSLAVAGPARLAHERSLARLADALRPPAELTGGEPVADENLRLQAGGLASYLSGRVLAGEAERLPDAHAEATIEERVEGSLAAAFDALASAPDMARLLFVEAPSAGEETALRYHEWLGRYGTLLRAVAPDLPQRAIPAPEVEAVIVGGIASRVGSEVLHGRAARLRDLTAPLVEYVLAFYGSAEPAARSAARRAAA